MKKSLLIFAIFSLIFVSGGIVLAQDQAQPQNQSRPPKQERMGTSTLEKISHPGEIKLFDKIKQIGNALFGVRKGDGQKIEQASSTVAITDNASSTLEKISSPKEINLFEKIKKIGTALWGVRKGDNKDNRPDNNKQPKPILVTSSAAQCVKDAIDKKDTAVKASIGAHSQSVLSLIDARGTCQKLAFDKITTKEQFDANKTCVETFKQGNKDSGDAMINAKNEAWKAYQGDLKACSALQTISTSTAEINTPSDQIMIQDGGEDLAPAN